MYFSCNMLSFCKGSHHALWPPTPPSQRDYLGMGAVTSQAGFLNLKIVNIILTLRVNNDRMWYTYFCLSSLIWFMLYHD